jgi:hypothetical protein
LADFGGLFNMGKDAMTFIRGKSRACRLGLLLPGLFLAALAHAETRWVHGSWVNVREMADAQSAVIEHVTTNTQVEVLTREDERCEIAWKDEKRGFVPCELLGERPLTLEGVDSSHPRAFWIAPSASALFHVGEYFRQEFRGEGLEAAQGIWSWRDNGHSFHIEKPKPVPLVRYPIPEFEAMKARLAEGIIAAEDMDPPLLSCREIQEGWEAQGYHFRYPSYEHFSHSTYSDLLSWWTPKCRSDIAGVELPKIRPSFFRDARYVLPRMAWIEQVSAHFGIVERGRVTSGPRWTMDQCGYTRYSGAWDIGGYELRLERPVVEHVIAADGRVGAYLWQEEHFYPYDLDSACTGGFHHQIRGVSPLPAYADIKAKEALFWFYAPEALPLKKVKVSRLIEPTEDNPTGVYEIDLDNDGSADFAYWADWGHTLFHTVFININGEWYLFDFDFDEECRDC